jgi:branched-chain amino acid aminotransferase
MVKTPLSQKLFREDHYNSQSILGQQVYEGLKAFRTPQDTIHIFRPDFHGTRLAHSASYVSLPAPPLSHFKKCIQHAVALNASFVPPANSPGFLYIRPLLFGSSAQLALSPPEEYILAVYVHPTSSYHGTQALDAVVLEDFDRAAPKGTGSAKVGGNYAPIYRWTEKAKKDGFGITLHLDSATRTAIEEFSTSGFIGITAPADSGAGSTPTLVVPDTENAINSCSSDSMVTIARDCGWKMEKRTILFSDDPASSPLSTFTEVLAVGTAAAAVPIRSITRPSTGQKFVFGGKVEEKYAFGQQLARTIADIQRGVAADKFGWCWGVEEVEAEEDQGEGLFSWLGKMIWG